MDVLTENFSLYGKGFLGTVELTVYSSILALVLGFLMASCRVAPSARCACSARSG